MYIIHDFIESNNPVAATDTAFNGIKNRIWKLVSSKVLRLKWKYNYSDALDKFIKEMKFEEEYGRLLFDIESAKEQLRDEYNDPLINELIDFNLDKEIAIIFLGQWSLTPRLPSSLGK
jgi:hypothetical protein